MSSVEIAELTEKDHKNVLADVRAMLESLSLDSADFLAQYQDSSGRSLPMFKLPRDLTETLITGYNIPLRHKVVVRLRELEEEKTKPTPVANLNDPASLRGLLLGYTEQVLQLEHKISEDKPKVDYFDDCADTGAVNLRQDITTIKLTLSWDIPIAVTSYQPGSYPNMQNPTNMHEVASTTSWRDLYALSRIKLGFV